MILLDVTGDIPHNCDVSAIIFADLSPKTKYMKFSRLAVSVLAVIIAMPAFACGPGGSMGSSGNKPPKTGRQKWVGHRIRILKNQMRPHEDAQRTADRLGEILDGADGKAGDIAATEARNQMPRALLVRQPQSAEEKKYMFNRFEYLALKKERKGLSAGEAAEMFALKHVLVNTGGSGR